jgi:TonB family protein
VIHFDFDDRYLDDLVVESAISRREGVLLSLLIHAGLVALLLFAPALPIFQPRFEEDDVARLELDRDERRLVFVQPRLDFEALRPPDRAELSDLDRRSQAPAVAAEPTNPLPFSLGDSAERTDAPEEEPEQRAIGPEGPDDPEPPVQPEPEPEPEQLARVFPPAELGLPRSSEAPPRPAGGLLGDALRNLERYVQNETFHNPQGGVTDPGATIQFDTKGVEFGPWLRRFVAQVRRNWFIPHAAMTFRGRVVLQFNIHKTGHITDLVVAQPSSIDAFNRAAYNAILGSNPTEPLPPEYPDPMAFFTVIFYYNEQPPAP